MYEAHIFAILEEKMRFNAGARCFGLAKDMLTSTVEGLPQLTPQQIRKLCKAQEENVYSNLFRFSKASLVSETSIFTKRSLQFALREEISKLSPTMKWT